MTMHYVAGGGIENNGQYTAGTVGFNLADVQSLEQLNALPEGTKGLVWLDKAEGVTSEFIQNVSQYIGNDKLWGFYLADEPDPTGKWGPKVSAADLKAESDWIHANVPGAKTFIVMMNMGMTSDPTYMNTYNPANTGIDYYGLDPYPIRTGGHLDLSVINKNVDAAIEAGIPLESIVPVYQAFGGGGWSTDTGGKYVMPTATQMKEMVDRWAEVVPDPEFDFTYHWESQNGDQALKTNSTLLDFFREHNASVDEPVTPPTVTEPVPPVVEPDPPVAEDDTDGPTVTPPVTDTDGDTDGPTVTPPVTDGDTDGPTVTPPVTETPTDPDTDVVAPPTRPVDDCLGPKDETDTDTGLTPPVTPTPPVVDTDTGGGRGHGWGNRGDWADISQNFAQKFAQKLAGHDSFRFSEAVSRFADKMANADASDFTTKVGANARFDFLDKLGSASSLRADASGNGLDASGHADASSPVSKVAGNHHFAWDNLWG